MGTRSLRLLLPLTAVALHTPVAHADPPFYDCHARTAHIAEVTGQTYQGVLGGFAAHLEASPVSIRCAVVVNGVPVATTAESSGAHGFALTQGDVSFVAEEGDTVWLVAYVTSAHGSFAYSTPYEPGDVRVPPQVVHDTVDHYYGEAKAIADPALCASLASVPPVTGVFEPNEQGDVYVDGEPTWDCPPYDEWEHQPGAPPVEDPDPAVSADSIDSAYARVGESETGTIARTNIDADLSAARSNHRHNDKARCSFDRKKKRVHIEGQMKLARHDGHRSTMIFCEVYNDSGVLLGTARGSSSGGEATTRATYSSTAKLHTVCMTARGVWNDGHISDLPRTCKVYER